MDRGTRRTTVHGVTELDMTDAAQHTQEESPIPDRLGCAPFSVGQRGSCHLRTHSFSYSFPNCCCCVAKLCLTLCDPKDCSTPGFPDLHCPQVCSNSCPLSDAIQPSHLLPFPSPPALHLSQHQGLFQWVGPLHQVAKVLELQLQHQSSQWIFRVDFF